MIDVQEKEGCLIVPLRIQPRAGKSAIVGEHAGALKLRIAAPPVHGAANEACIGFLSETFGVKRSQIKILSGHTSQNKLVRIEGLSKSEFLKVL